MMINFFGEGSFWKLGESVATTISFHDSSVND